VIGAYERLVMRTDTGPHHTSIAAEPHLFPTDERCYHHACFRPGGTDGVHH
jgi:hypothetical protein